MAEKKNSNGYRLKVIGPKEGNAEVLHFPRDNNRKSISLVPGQVITVSNDGGQLTTSEAKRLQSTTSWEFEKGDVK